jgi:phosphoenolpyruvate---glycerone phosphotransferase subunit DhaL
MSNTIDYGQYTKVLMGAVEIIRENHAMLSSLDAETGDGDHGVTMLRAMNKVGEVITTYATKDLKSLTYDIGWALLGIDGGSTGPLFGSLFMGMSEVLEGVNSIDSETWAKMFESGLTAIQLQTKAQVGDKTMIDALVPAINAMRSSANKGEDLTSLMKAAAKASEDGAAATKTMQARFGRAKHQGERTIGHQDPGATSTSLIFRGLLNGLK